MKIIISKDDEIFISFDLLKQISNINTELTLLKHVLNTYKTQTFILDFVETSKKLEIPEQTLKTAMRKLVRTGIIIQKFKKMPIYQVDTAALYELRRKKDDKDNKDDNKE